MVQQLYQPNPPAPPGAMTSNNRIQQQQPKQTSTLLAPQTHGLAHFVQNGKTSTGWSMPAPNRGAAPGGFQQQTNQQNQQQGFVTASKPINATQAQPWLLSGS